MANNVSTADSGGSMPSATPHPPVSSSAHPISGSTDPVQTTISSAQGNVDPALAAQTVGEDAAGPSTPVNKNMKRTRTSTQGTSTRQTRSSARQSGTVTPPPLSDLVGTPQEYLAKVKEMMENDEAKERDMDKKRLCPPVTVLFPDLVRT